VVKEKDPLICFVCKRDLSYKKRREIARLQYGNKTVSVCDSHAEVKDFSFTKNTIFPDKELVS
jgi:uncharacterized CHY-type Zn-finger protein